MGVRSRASRLLFLFRDWRASRSSGRRHYDSAFTKTFRAARHPRQPASTRHIVGAGDRYAKSFKKR